MIPLIIVSDAPNMQSGLGRIARDLTYALWINREKLGIIPSQLGMNYDGSPFPWRIYPITDDKTWGAEDLKQVLEWEGARSPYIIVLTIWDPYRCFSISEVAQSYGADLWGYFPIDAHNMHGKISGPPLDALKRYERTLAYGPFGAKILKDSLSHSAQWLPHGLSFDLNRKYHSRGDILRQCNLPRSFLKHDIVIGCVATNQHRKDWAVVFQAVDVLRTRFAAHGKSVGLWCHTNSLIGPAWSLPQLADDCELTKNIVITEEGLSDQDLYTNYSVCHATINPGLGEGFGYPIVESMMIGTPPVHGSYGGGSYLIPDDKWIVSKYATRLDGYFANVRPVYDHKEFANALEIAIKAKLADPSLMYTYLRGAVTHLNWQYLWPRWESWFKQGIVDIKGRYE